MSEEFNQKLTFEEVMNILLVKDMRTIKSYVKDGWIPEIAIDKENFTIDAVALAKEMGAENFDELFISSMEAHEMLGLPQGSINQAFCKNKGLNYYRLKNSLRMELLFRKSEIESYLSIELKHFPFEGEKVTRLKYFLEINGFLEILADATELSESERGIFLAYLDGKNLENISKIHNLEKSRIRQILDKVLRKSISKLNFTEKWLEALREANFLHIQPTKLVEYVNDLHKLKVENQILKERLKVYEPELITETNEEIMLRKLLDTPIEDLDLSVRAYNCLRNEGVNNLGDITKIEPSNFLKWRLAGKKTLLEIEALLESKGLSFKKE